MTVLALSYMIAEHTTESKFSKNPWYTRPDLRPKRVMVEENDEEKALMKHVREISYLKDLAAKNREEGKKSALYRFLFPYSADYRLRSNPVKDLAVEYKHGRYENGKLNFQDHHYDM